MPWRNIQESPLNQVIDIKK